MGTLLVGATASFFSIRNNINGVLTTNFPAIGLADEVLQELEVQRSALIATAGGQFPRAKDQFSPSIRRTDQAIRELLPLMEEADETVASNRLAATFGSYQERAVNLMAANEMSTQPGFVSSVETDLFPLIDDMKGSAAKVASLNRANVELENDRARDAASRFSNIGMAVTVFALGAALLMALRIIRVALTPLAIIAKQAEKIGRGDMTAKLELPRKDEIGDLADTFNDMANRLATLKSDGMRRLERAQRLSDAAINSLYDPVIVVDHKERIVNLNAAAINIFGRAPTSPRVPLAEHIPDHRIVEAIANAVDAGRISDSEDDSALAQIRVADLERTFRIRATPMRSDEGELLGAVAVLEDVTYLRELDTMKTEFIGVAAHELRTPVTSLLLGNELLLEGAVGDLNPDQKEMIQVQKDDLSRLEKLTRDLLDVTRLDQKTMKTRKEILPPADLLRATQKDLDPAARSAGVTLEFKEAEGVGPIYADRVQILRVLINLTSNAIRHTPSGGRVEVTVQKQGNQVSFRVSDSGEGIPPEYLERIFERFVQVPGATQGGAGLGLSIARKIVKNHGGDMKVESEFGKGSVFTFTLPAHEESLS
jgi:signal transduction histidine kinase